MSTLLPVSVTIARIQAMQKGPAFPYLTNKKDKVKQDPIEKVKTQERIRNLINSVSVPCSFPNLKDAVKEMRNEINGKYVNQKKI